MFNLARAIILFAVGAGLPSVVWAQQGDSGQPPRTGAAKGWRLVHFGKANGNLARDGDAVAVTITAVDGTGWHAQVQYGGTRLVEGSTYRLHFRAKANGPREMVVSGQIDGPDYHLIGLDQTVHVSTDWKDYSVRFTAANIGGKPYLAPEFFLGDKVGEVWLSDVTLTGEGVQAGQSQALTADLATPPPPDLPLAITRLKTPESAWDLLRHGRVGAGISRQDGALVIHVTQSDGVGWHVQLSRPSVVLHEGQSYVVRFRAKSDVPHDIQFLSLADGGDYQNVGLDQAFPLTTSWRDYQAYFIARGMGGKRVLVPSISLGQQTGTVWLSRISVLPNGGR